MRTGIWLMTGRLMLEKEATSALLPLVSQIICRSTTVRPEASTLMPTPASTCSHLNRIVSTPCSSPHSAPASMAVSSPSQTLFVKYDPTTPKKAPMSMVPSRPMLMMPLRSESVPPRAAKAMGMDTRIDPAIRDVTTERMSSILLKPPSSGGAS